MIIFPWTPTDVAVATLGSWQRRKELQLLDRMQGMAKRAERAGLEARRVQRVMSLSAKAWEKAGGA